MKISCRSSCKRLVFSLLFLSVFLLNGLLDILSATGREVGQKPVLVQSRELKNMQMILRCDVYDTKSLSNAGFAALLCQRVADRLAARVVDAGRFAYISEQGGTRLMGHLTVHVKTANRIAYHFVKGTADEWAGHMPGKSRESEIMVMDAGHLTPVIDQLVLDLERMK